MKIAITMCGGKKMYNINQAYVDYVVAAGYIPVAVFPTDSYKDTLVELVDTCDGLLIPGGIDIDPVYYQEDNFTSYNVDPAKDQFERDVLYAFTNVGKPVFGICRGYQLIAREFLQNIQEDDRAQFINYAQNIAGHRTNATVDTARGVRTHSVLANLNRLYKNKWEASRKFERVFVNSMHHQGLLVDKSKMLREDKAGIVLFDSFDDLRVLAITKFGVNASNVAAKDVVYVVEAFEAKFGKSIVRGVQWHPEELNDVDLLKGYFNNYGKTDKNTKTTKAEG